MLFAAVTISGYSRLHVSVITGPSPVGVRDLMSVEASGIFFMNLAKRCWCCSCSDLSPHSCERYFMGQAGALQFTRFVMYEGGREGIFGAVLIFEYEQFGDVCVIEALFVWRKNVDGCSYPIICLLPKMVKTVGNWGLGCSSSYRKQYDHWHGIINTQVDEFSNGFKTAAKNIPEMCVVHNVTLLQLAAL